MDASIGIGAKISQEQDDLLATIQLVHDNDILSRHLFDSLVDRLVAGLFADLRRQHLEGRITDSDLAHELLELTAQCSAAGLATPL